MRNDFANVRIDYNSYKTNNKIEYFTPFNDAPIDDEKFIDVDFSKACWVARYCGIGLNYKEYYGCAVCGGIDRVLGEDDSYSTLKDLISDLTRDKLKSHYSKFCRYCGNFKYYADNKGECIQRCEKGPFKNIVSKTWQELYM